jgi:2-dehydropantoate 2-reductase
VAVVGCGALGSYYGACLARAGQDVTFLLRSDFEVVSQRGVRVVDAYGVARFEAWPRAVNSAKAAGTMDLVIIGLKTTANGVLAETVLPMVGPRTFVLTLQNGLGNEEALAALVGGERVLGGLCFVCLNRIEPGLIQHIAHGRIVMGEFGRAALDRTRQIAALFENAGIPCTVTDHLERAHWEKLVWNIPFNGLGVASAAGLAALEQGVIPHRTMWGPCLTTDRLLADPAWLAWVRGLMQETLAAARAQGLSIPDGAAEEQIRRTQEMGAYRASTLIDFERGQPLELESLFTEPLRRARAAGVTVPRLEALHRVLSCLDPAQRG